MTPEPPVKPTFTGRDRLECLEYALRGRIEDCPQHRKMVEYREALAAYNQAVRRREEPRR